MCRWTELHGGGAELRVSCQSILFNSWFNPSGYKVLSFSSEKYSLSSAVVCFLICSIKVNLAWC